MLTEKIYNISVWVMRIVILNVLWVLFNLPLFYVSLNLFLGDFEHLKLVFLTIVVLAPFFLYPSTAALYGITRKWSMGETDLPLFRSFWRFYKDNYIKSLLGGILFTILWAGITFNFLFLPTSGFMNIVYGTLAAFLFAWNIQFLAYNVHFESTFLLTLKNTFMLTAGAPFISLGILLIHIGVIYVTFNIPVLLFICTAAVSSYLCYLLYYYFIKKMELLNKRE